MKSSFYNRISAPGSLYLHIPYCHSKCSYCDFFSCSVSNKNEINRFCKQLIHFLEQILVSVNSDYIRTLYIGGGNPGILGVENLSEVIGKISDLIASNKIREWTVELNPEDVTENMLDFLNASPVTRLSVGVQTFDESLHHTLGRNSTIERACKALELIKHKWEGSWNADLIYGIPGQHIEHIRDDMDSLIFFDPDHISLYSLIPEPETALGKRILSGSLQLPDDEEIIEFEKYQRDFLISRGFIHYEISNFCKTGKQSLHNLSYWKMKSYLGIGPGSVSTVLVDRHYIERLEWSHDLEAFNGGELKINQEIIDNKTFLKDWLMMNFRKYEGFSSEEFSKIFKLDFYDTFSDLIDNYSKINCLKTSDKKIRLTEKGMDTFNDILSTFFKGIDQIEYSKAPLWD